MGFIIELIVSFAWWIILFPIVWIIASPFILIGAVFHRLPFLHAVSLMYSKVTKIWADWGLIVSP